MKMSAWVFIWFAFPINLCSISGQTEKPPPNWWFFRFIHCHKRMPNCCIEGLFHICLGVTEFPIITIPMAISSTGRNKNRIKKIKQIEQKVLSNVWIDLQFRGEKTTSTMKAAAFNVVELSNVCIGRHLLFRTKLKNIAVGLLFFSSFRGCEIAMVNALHWSECFEWFIEFR